MFLVDNILSLIFAYPCPPPLPLSGLAWDVHGARLRWLTNNSIVAEFVDFYHFDGSLYCLSLHH